MFSKNTITTKLNFNYLMKKNFKLCVFCAPVPHVLLYPTYPIVPHVSFIPHMSWAYVAQQFFYFSFIRKFILKVE